MADGGTVVIALVCEAPADGALARCLTDRVLHQRIDWLREHGALEECQALLDGARQYQGHAPGTELLKWSELRGAFVAAGLSPRALHGRFNEEPDARQARMALRLLAAGEPRPSAVLLLRDLDNRDERRAGLLQARNDNGWPFHAIIVGTAQKERESWVLSGFVARDDAERARHRELTTALSLDPCAQPERLREVDEGEPRHPKRVLRSLCGDDRARERACYEETALAVLRERGRENGLAAFLDELEGRLVPVFAGGGQRG